MMKIFCATMAGQPTTSFLDRSIMKLPEGWRQCIAVRGEKYVFLLEEILLIYFYKNRV
jgi:hypothetical protein